MKSGWCTTSLCVLYHVQKKSSFQILIAFQVIPGVSITVGQDKDDGGSWPYAGTASAVEQMGAKHVNKDVHISFHQSLLCNPSVAIRFLRSGLPFLLLKHDCKIRFRQISFLVKVPAVKTDKIAFGVERTHSWYRLESRLYGTTLIEWMDLGTRIWHPPQILQVWMTSSPTWQRRERLDRTHSLIFDYYLLQNIHNHIL